ncbi:hypothetical protein [Streptomyces sp. CT34]|uniref:hypothetical protein n=1 Tax=Streptomyces sp. CT34 TaxID=1553907 RepID=UPI0012FEF27A|nr:hypothetical protein [Streptomyces sp. CT34]
MVRRADTTDARSGGRGGHCSLSSDGLAALTLTEAGQLPDGDDTSRARQRRNAQQARSRAGQPPDSQAAGQRTTQDEVARTRPGRTSSQHPNDQQRPGGSRDVVS